MKYGPIICDPTSEEAKKLVGKKVVGEWNFSAVKSNPETYTPFTLAHIDDSCNPFDGFTFIREVIEEPPQYRPYKDTDEMVEDFCQRFGVVNSNCSLPVIWVKGKVSAYRLLVEGYSDCMAFLSYDGKLYLSELFDYYTYLDGSPVGKEIKE